MMSLPLKSTGQHCFACREPVNERDCLQLIDRLCHLKCFKCQTCRQNLNSNMFCVALGDLYCEKHYTESLCDIGHDGIGRNNSQLSNGRWHTNSHRQDKLKCFICGMPVEEPEPLFGPSGIFHGGCFRCQQCRRMLNIDKYKVIRGKLYCEPTCEECFNRPERSNSHTSYQHNGYGGTRTNNRGDVVSPVSTQSSVSDKCFNCGLSVKPKDHLRAMNRLYHRDCFRCRRCDIVLSPDKFNIENEKPCCQPSCIDQIEQRSVKFSNAGNLNGQPHLSHSTSLHSYTERTKPALGRHSDNLGNKLGEIREGTYIIPANVDKIAKIHRRLEEIQASGSEDDKCFKCGRKVYPAERLSLLSRIYHPGCFKCDKCERILSGGRYNVHDGKIYCVAHYREVTNLKSASTTNLSKEPAKPLKTEYIPKPDLPKIQTSTPIVQNEHEIFQEPKPEELKCYECAIKVYPAEQLNILSRVYHRQCFRCKTCQNVLDLGRFGVHDGAPYCNAHHRQAVNLGSLSSLSVSASNAKTPATPQQKRMALHVSSELLKCYECDEKVYPAEQLNILKRVYHRTCFKCKTCNKVLNVGRYGVYNGNPYCNPHHKQIINLHSTSMSNVNVTSETNSIKMESNSGKSERNLSKTRCFECGELTHPASSVILIDRVYHVECLKCRICQQQLGRWNYKELDGLIYCAKDHAQALATRTNSSVNVACENNQTGRTLFV